LNELTTGCPYCDNQDVTVDVTVKITCHLNKDRQLVVNDWWIPNGDLKEAATTASLRDMNGFCSKCGEYFDVDADNSGKIYFKKNVEEEY